jgi:hypothetical protein
MYGASVYEDAKNDVAKWNNLKILEEKDSNKLYSELKRIAKEELKG